MKRFIRFIEFDTGLQFMLMLLTVLSAFTIIGLAVMMPILGAWQVISGVVGYYYLKDKMHLYYLGACAVALSLMTIPFITGFDNMQALIMLFIIIPAIMAIVYYKAQCKILKRLKQSDYRVEHETHEDILDEALLWN